MSSLLTLTIIIPLIAAALIQFIPKEKATLVKYLGVGVTGVVLLLTLFVFFSFDPEGGFQFVEKASWINVSLGEFGYLSANYYLAVDGISVSMVLLSGIVFFVGAIASFNIQQKIKGYFSLYLILTASVIGCFVALDMLLFYLFFEFMLLPLYFLIGIWGGKRREYAAIKFFIYTLVGSVFILLAMIGLYASVIDPYETIVNLGWVDSVSAVTNEMLLKLNINEIDSRQLVHTFDMILMQDESNYLDGSILASDSGSLIFGSPARVVAFLAVFIGFAIKLPAAPLHTWLPDAHVEAPTAVSVVFAGILLKVGGYGLIRVAYSIFPAEAASFSFWIAVLGVLSILWGAYNALSSKDLKRLVAYSSVSHMGFVLLGLAAFTVESNNGAIYVMFSHGLLSAMLFVLVGVLYDRTKDRFIDSYKGLAALMPHYTALITVAFFASLGLPGFSTFIGEVFVFLGAFLSEGTNGLVPRWLVAVALLGLVLGAAYFLWALQRVFFGKFWVKDESWKPMLKDLTTREYIMLVPLAVLSLLFGILPGILLDKIAPGVNDFVEMIAKAL